MSRLYDVTPAEVDTAWKAVCRAGGGAGYDEIGIKDVKADEGNYLYKVWNRLSSGSYIPAPVLLVNIPKAKGCFRQLGIPTVVDRIAQTVIKMRLEAVLQPLFHEDSYAYQAGKGAIEAVTKARERCMKKEWVLEIDIKAFFDELEHDLLMGMVEKYVTDKATLLYVKKFIKAPGRTESGEETVRGKGTPQGGVVSPVLANLYLHEAFDSWMQEEFPDIGWERYADDIIVHCVSEKQAYFMKARIEGRMKMFKLTLHPEKTRVVYSGTRNDHDHRGHNLSRKFTFLGYDFKPRNYKGGIVFTPGIGSGALKMIRQKIKKDWGLLKRTSSTLEEIAESTNAVIRGWINYYGHHRRSDLYLMAHMVDACLVGFIKRKYKSVSSWKQGWRDLKEQREKQPKLFCHWYMISPSKRGAV
jgi:RNA-directed DNA polymerase